MLERLIGANGHAELLPGFGVLQRFRIQHAHDADGLSGEGNHRLIGQGIYHRECSALIAQQRVSAYADVLEGNIGDPLAVHHRVSHLVDASCRRIDKKQ